MGFDENAPHPWQDTAWRALARRNSAQALNGTTFLAGLRTSGTIAPMVFHGPINGMLLSDYADQILMPELRPGDVVIMDNLGSDKGAGVRAAMEAVGAALLYLPPTARFLTRSKRHAPS